MAALDAVAAIVPERKLHAVGYCLGGAMLSIAAAAMAQTGDERLASLTLFATETDFTEPGELGLFIAESYAAEIIAHGMWGGSLLSTLLGTKLPGPGTIYVVQTLHFRHPVTVGDTITVSVIATEKDAVRPRIRSIAAA